MILWCNREPSGTFHTFKRILLPNKSNVCKSQEFPGHRSKMFIWFSSERLGITFLWYAGKRSAGHRLTVWSNLKKQVEEQKLTNWSWSCDKAGTIRIWPRSWAAAHVASANTDSFSSLFANKNLWNVWNACDWLRNIFFPKDIRAAFLQPETHVCCISVTFSANLAWTQLLVWSDSLQPTAMCHTCAASRVRILGSFSIWDFFIKFFLPTSHFADFFMLTLGRVRVFYSFFHCLSSALPSLFLVHACGWSWPHVLASYQTPVWGAVEENLAIVWFLFSMFLINRSHHKALGVTLQCRLHSLPPEFVLFFDLWTLWFLLIGQQFLVFLFNMRRPWFLLVQAAVPLLVTETLFRKNLLCCSDVELWVVCRDKINVSNSP